MLSKRVHSAPPALAADPSDQVTPIEDGTVAIRPSSTPNTPTADHYLPTFLATQTTVTSNVLPAPPASATIPSSPAPTNLPSPPAPTSLPSPPTILPAPSAPITLSAHPVPVATSIITVGQPALLGAA